MSFSYLPWPLYVIMTLTITIVLLLYVKNTYRTHPKIFNVGLVCIALDSIIAGIYKITDSLGLIGQYLWILQAMSFIVSIIGLILIIVGAYNKSKFNPAKKKIMIIIIFTLVFSTIICGIILVVVCNTK